jgi:hypothetical protein
VRLSSATDPKPRSRLRVETLIALLGPEDTATLCQFGGGRRVPSYAQFRAWQRRLLLLNDWLNHGYTHRALAAKYGLSIPVVKKLVTTYRRRLLADRLATMRGALASTRTGP